MSTPTYILVLITILLTACSFGPSGGPPSRNADNVARISATPSRTDLAAETPTPVDPTPTFFQDRAAFEQLHGLITIDGSSTVFPITEVAGLAFKAQASAVQIQLGVSGTGGGFKKFCAGETDVSDASRPIKQSEAVTCATNGVVFIEVPIAFDGISLVVNRDNNWARCITTAELRRLWSPASEAVVTRWNQIRLDWPDQPINLYGPGKESGTYDYFTESIIGEEGTSRTDFTGSEDDYLIAQDVTDDPNGLGFFGYAYYAEYQDQLNIVAVDSGTGCVEPNQETIADGTYQPLSRPLFLYIRDTALERPEVAAFVDFYLRNVTRFVATARYVALPNRAYELGLQRVATRRTGSVFDGGSQVGVSIEELLEIEEQ